MSLMPCLRDSCHLVIAALSVAASGSAAEEGRAVISSNTVNVGSHAVIIQRVEPPAASVSTDTATSLRASTFAASSTTSLASTFTNSNRLRPDVLSLSCTRYECGVTEVRWQSVTGGEYRILSSIDFNYLRNTGAFTDGEHSYTVFMGVGTAMPVTMNASTRVLSAAKLSPVAPPVDAATLATVQTPGLSRYVTIASPEKPHADAFRGIAALHRYYDVHKDELIAQWQQLESERIAREQYEKLHPPQPKDTVIQFWPKKNSRYLTPSAAITDAANGTQTASGKEAK